MVHDVSWRVIESVNNWDRMSLNEEVTQLVWNYNWFIEVKKVEYHE